MQIAVLVGSLRKESYNRSVFNAYRKFANGNVTFTEGTFADFPLYSAEIEDAGIPESVLDLGRLIKKSDALLIFSPEYNASIPGVLKNAIDWLSRIPEPEMPLTAKKAAVISASPGKLGGARMQAQLRLVAATLDIRLVNRPEILVSEAHKKIDDQGVLTDETTLKYLKKHYDSFTASS